jgi:hypothetical protein
MAQAVDLYDAIVFGVKIAALSAVKVIEVDEILQIGISWAGSINAGMDVRALRFWI